MNMTANLEAMLARGQDNAMLRLALASRYFEEGDMHRAAEHAAAATTHDPDYSAAWKLLGRAQAAAGMDAKARAAFQRGIDVATRRGDEQAAREMSVFLRRLDRTGS